MASIKKLIQLLFGICAFVYTFYVVGKLMLFLSVPRSVHAEFQWILNLMDNRSKQATALPALVYDLILIILFILQHSLMKSKVVKSLVSSLKLEASERSIYSMTSSLSLAYLMKNWMPIPTICLWQIDLENRVLLYWTFTIVHLFAWMTIYGGSLIMDLPEILGIKQVYYDIKQYSDPMVYKSFELRHLYQHVRHPSFVGFSLILFVTNVMSLDRLLLATMLFIYMYVAWSTDHNDIIYQKCQLERKRNELNNANRVHTY